MNEMIRTVLKRLLSEELGRQQAWCESDKKLGIDNAEEYRNHICKTIEDFMKENDIEEDVMLKRYGYLTEKETR